MIFVAVAMFGCAPAILMLFTAVPARRAVTISFLGCWLFLPAVGFPLPGLPDYTKLSAPPAIILLGIAINDPERLLSLKARLFDAPAIVWCFCPFASSVMNGLGVYDGISNTLGQILSWGVQYLIGRLYFTSLEGLRDLAVAVVTGGLIYTPLCLWEVRMSPNLNRYIYGFSNWEPMRYSGFRPKVFMATGLELGMWMTACTLVAYGLWASGTLKRFRDYPFGPLVALMLGTTILCKATGAVMLLVVGAVVLLAARVTRSALPLLLLVVVPLAYEATRATGVWSGAEAVDFAVHFISDDRAQSLKFRLDNENLLVAKALQQPVFGWSGWGRARAYDKNGEDISVTDGYWIITLGNLGMVGLLSMTSVLLLPAVLFAVRYPAASWNDPRVRPAAVLAVLLVLWMIDNLSNAMFNPLYVLMAGGLMGLETSNLAATARGGAAAAAGTGPARKVGPAEGDGAAIDDPLWLLGRRRARSRKLATAGHGDADDDLRGESLLTLERLVEAHPGVTSYRLELAGAAADLGRSRIDAGRSRDAVGPWIKAVGAYRALAESDPDDPGHRHRLLAHLNDFAWLLATDADADVVDPAQAVSWAEVATEGEPDNPTYWNTLGAARVRAGRFADAVAALEESVRLGGGTAFDYFYLALAHSRSGDSRAARHWYDRAVAWADEHDPGHPHLVALRREASATFNLPVVYRGASGPPAAV